MTQQTPQEQTEDIIHLLGLLVILKAIESEPLGLTRNLREMIVADANEHFSSGMSYTEEQLDSAFNSFKPPSSNRQGT